MPNNLHISYDGMLEYICAKKKMCRNVLKIAFKKSLKWFLILMKFVVFTKHHDSIRVEYVCEPCEKFDNYHIANEFFFKVLYKYAIN
jgi:hypothetical protein